MSLLRKGAITRRGGRPAGLAPQKVTELDGSDPTRDTYQRKVFYDDHNFFVIFWSATDFKINYAASADGKTWASPVTLTTLVSPGVYAGGGNLDVCYPNLGALDSGGQAINVSIIYGASFGGGVTWRPYTISGQTLTARTASSQGGQTSPQMGTLVSNLNGASEYGLYHRNAVTDRVRTIRFSANVYDASDSSISHGGTTVGGNQLLPYKTSSPYVMLALSKGSDNKLYYNTVNEPTATFAGTFTVIATLGAGFSDFCACSEAQNLGNPEIIHLVYIKSSGELCYRKFENDAWSDELELVSSGASYPIIAAGNGGRVYVFYVKDGAIKLLKYSGASWGSEAALFPEHTYNNPTYLSSNQNVQSHKVCLVWCEGTSAPYEVWFCYLED